MEPAAYLKEFVRPNYEIAQADPTNKLKLFNAIVPAYHMIDAIAPKLGYTRKNQAELENLIFSKVPQFVFISDAANAYKHITIDNNIQKGSPQKRTRDITELVQARVGPEAAFSDCTYWDGHESWSDAQQTFVIIDDDGYPHDLLCCLDWAIRLWEEYLRTGRI